MSDCYYKKELCEIAGIRYEYLDRVIARYPDFPIIPTPGRKYIIPKFKFFPWYDRHRGDPMIAGKFDGHSIDALRASYNPPPEIRAMMHSAARRYITSKDTEDKTMHFDDYQQLARRTQNPALLPLERRLHALHGIAAEAGEINGIYQKTYQGHSLDKDKVIDELGDLLWFAAELADVLNISLDYVAEKNIAKLRARYPEGFEEARSVHREGAR